jgi:ADP-dependent NAD(P)H-hydrate dehydratase / NAD(P)H-hydrate epimerase
MKILTSKQLKELDAYTIRHEPVDSIDLMERAAVAMASEIVDRFGTAHRIVVFAGPGNNGGDALAIARLLAEQGVGVEAYFFNITGKVSPDCEKNARRLSAKKTVKFTEITSQFEPLKLTDSDIVVDGLFGTGLNKPLGGGFAALVNYINSQPARVVAVDIPSGLMCEDNSYNVRRNIVRADVTLTVELPKLAFFLADMACYTGEVVTVKINLSREYREKADTPYSTLELPDISAALRPRNPWGHKGTFGHALLVAGSYGMAGAGVLAARACLRSGAGKLTVHVPQCNDTVMQLAVPEAVLSVDSATRCFTHAESTVPYAAVAIGPGLGMYHDTAQAFIEQTRNCDVPLVVDADGINILAQHRSWLAQLPPGTILTPHPGEFSRLAETGSDCYAMLAKAREMAAKYQHYIVLKGHHTFINTPGGHTLINTTGNSGMATAGSGDVLTGMLLGLLAQGYAPREACCLGVYLHGLAGDCSARRLGEHSVTASDIVNGIPEAFRELKTENSSQINLKAKDKAI